MGGFSYARGSQGEARCRDKEAGGRALRGRLRVRGGRKKLSVPKAAVGKWQQIYRAFGSEVLLTMDGKQARYTYEQRVAAASAVVDGGMTRTEAMAEFGIMSRAPLDRWCRLYREGGAEALRPKPKGRPRGSASKPRELTREQELEERCRRLETEVAYLKNCAPW